MSIEHREIQPGRAVWVIEKRPANRDDYYVQQNFDGIVEPFVYGDEMRCRCGGHSSIYRTADDARAEAVRLLAAADAAEQLARDTPPTPVTTVPPLTG